MICLIPIKAKLRIILYKAHTYISSNKSSNASLLHFFILNFPLNTTEKKEFYQIKYEIYLFYK